MTDAAVKSEVASKVESFTADLQASVDAEDAKLASLVAAADAARSAWKTAQKAVDDARDPEVQKVRDFLAQMDLIRKRQLVSGNVVMGRI